MLGALLLACTAPAAQQPAMSQRDMPEYLNPHAARLKPLRIQRLIGERVKKNGIEAETADLRERLARLAERGDRSRLEAVCLALREPWLLPSLVEHYSRHFEKDSLRLSLTHAADLVDSLEEYVDHTELVETGDPKDLRIPSDSMEEILGWIEENLARANEQVDRALAKLEPADREHVAAHWLDLSERFEEHIYLYTDEDEERRRRNEETIRIGESVGRGSLLQAAGWAWKIEVAAQYLRGAAEAEGLDVTKKVVAERSTPHGRILIAGTGNDWHRSGDVAVLIDLGGDDFYSNNIASTVGQAEEPALGVSVLVDLEGNDAYEATHRGAMGFGLLGVGLLVDHAGNDSYVGLRWTQGAGYMGVGMLVDLEGDDRYRCHALSQGVGLWGFGMLADFAGDDRYEGHVLAQAVGLAGGAGVLHDQGGDDEY
ncbi:MAG: hypothetical protein O7B99_12100, partial [Planctomycetota bacterium]|nr:hypothetical protein [Planctomycetota bacterium]